MAILAAVVPNPDRPSIVQESQKKEEKDESKKETKGKDEVKDDMPPLEDGTVKARWKIPKLELTGTSSPSLKACMSVCCSQIVCTCCSLEALAKAFSSLFFSLSGTSIFQFSEKKSTDRKSHR